MNKLNAENNLRVAEMMLDEIIEAGEVEKRQEEVNELLDFIIRVKRILKELDNIQTEE